MKPMIWGMALSVLATGAADAALLSRAGGQAYYDDVLDITWVADANLAKTQSNDSDGLMTWEEAQRWIGMLNTANYLGASNWRLPNIVDTGALGCESSFSGTDCGYNVQTGSVATTVYSELASLYYDTLGNLAQWGTSGYDSSAPDWGMQPGWGLTNTSPFSNLQPDFYWSGATHALNPRQAVTFRFYNGEQSVAHKNDLNYALAVSPGDALVPVPAVAWLVAGAFAGIGAAAKRRAGTGTA